MKKIQYSHFYLFCLCIFMMFPIVNLLYGKFDDDLLWHIKLGEEILRTGKVSTVDTFSWQEGLTWINHEWLYDVFIYLVVHYMGIIGFTGVYVLKAFFLLFGGAFLSKAKRKGIYVLLATVLFFFTPSNQGNRPSEFSIWIIILSVYLFRSDINVKKRCVYLFLIGILLANFHGGCIVTVLAFALIITGVNIAMDIKERIFTLKKSVSYFIPVIVYAVGSLMNPSGIKLLYVGLRTPFLETSKYIQEWQQTEFNYLTAFFFMLFVLTFGYKLGKEGYTRNLCVDVALLCAAGILGMTSVRGCMVYLYMWLIYGYRYFEQAVFEFLPDIKSLTITANRFVTIILVLLVGPLYVMNFPETLDFNEYVMSLHSADVVEELQNISGEKIFHGYNDGNFLIYLGIPCFIDSRQFPYTRELGNSSLDKFVDIVYTERNLGELENYVIEEGFSYVYVSDSFPNEWFFAYSDLFQLVFEDVETKEKIYKVQVE